MVDDRTRYRSLRFPSLLPVAVVLGCALISCRQVDATEQIRRLVRSAAKSAGERDVAGIMANVANDFNGRLGFDSGDDIVGAVDARQLRFLLLRYLQRGNQPTVLIRSIDVALNGPQARATVLAMVSQSGGTVGPRGAIDPDRGELLKLDLVLENRDSRWWVVAAQRTPLAAGEFLLGN